MATDRRRAVATASTGAALTTAGGVLRHSGTLAANNGRMPEFDLRHPRRWAETHQTRALLRTGARGRKRYLLGATLGLVGAPALAVGVHDTVTRKRDDRRSSFVHEGLRGTQDALEQRAEGIKEVPPQHKAGPLAVSAATGFAGSLGAHRTLDRLKSFRGARHSARAGITALTGTTLAGASYPLARHTVRSNDYEVTPTGVRRRKKPLVRPSSKAKVYDAKRMSRGDYRRATVGEASKVHNPHNLVPVTSRGTPRKVHWRNGDADHAVCGLDGAFGRGTGPFADHYGEVTCRGCARVMRIRKGWSDDRAEHPKEMEHPLTDEELKEHLRRDHRWGSAEHRDRLQEIGELRKTHDGIHNFPSRLIPNTHIHVTRIIGKAAGDYSGRRTSPGAQRAAILAAGATPVIGGVAGARTAGHFAPPGERGKTEVRQYGLTTAGSVSGGLAGAYGTSVLASRHAGVARATERAAAAHGRASDKVRHLRPVNATMARLPKGGRTAARVASVKEVARGSKLARPLARSPIAAGVGYVAGKTIGGYAGSGIAMRRNQRDQREYNLKHPVVKYVENMTVAERRKLSRKKRIAAASSTTTGVLGLGALAARAKKRPDLALNLLTGSAAIGGVNNLNFAGVLRREAKATDPRVKKAAPTSVRAHELSVSFARKGALVEQRRALALRNRLKDVGKADHREPLTRMHGDTAAQIVRRHGDAGPLPANLSRSERMQAYEARYVHAGGHKAEHWQRRADRADKVKTAGLAGATAGGVGIMALRHPRVTARLGHRAEHARHAVDTATIGAATVSGAGELYAGHARRRRASYSNSKAGVAASALRRMRDYSA